MYELSLFTGAGGGLLGTSLLGWTPVGYVEWNDYCQRIIAARIRDGILPVAPIFSDVRTFISEGYAASYTGMVDVITAGFPCQPFSVAGKQAGADDPRNMWPATRDIISLVRPRYCFLENVPGLLNSGYFGTIVRDLAESGYCVRWRILSAAELGAPHQRDRLWIVAHADRTRQPRHTKNAGGLAETGGVSPGNGTGSHSTGRADGADMVTGKQYPAEDQPVADAQGERCNRRNGVQKTTFEAGRLCAEGDHQSPGDVADTDCKPAIRFAVARQKCTTWTVEPQVGRVVNGLADRVDRLRACGNGQVPAVVRAAWELLTAG